MINVVCGIRSTGRICTDLAVELEKQGHEVKIAYGRNHVPDQFQKYALRIGSDLDVVMHAAKTFLQDGAGFGSRKATEQFIDWVKEWDPDVIHLHNIHGYYLNVEVLFDYLRTCGKKIIWTLHDCWTFTGHCAYFDYAGCGKWKTGCEDCGQKGEYPISFTDGSRRNWLKKRELFTSIPHVRLVTPSKWLADLVKASYMGEYPVSVIHNGIDVSVFQPTPSNVKEKYGIGDQKVILGVAAPWSPRKGLNDMAELARKVKEDYCVVVIGATQKQKADLPDNITVIPQTNSTAELAEWYTAAEVFVNSTLEDNYPTTNLEAIACGTPVVTYDTGGSPESASYYGRTVAKGDVEGMLGAFYELSELQEQPKISPSVFSREAMVDGYMDLLEDACVFSKSCISRIAYLPRPFFVRKTGAPTATSCSTSL